MDDDEYCDCADRCIECGKRKHKKERKNVLIKENKPPLKIREITTT